MTTTATTSRLIRHAARNTSRFLIRPSRVCRPQSLAHQCRVTHPELRLKPGQQCFSSSSRSRAGLMPGSEDPPAPQEHPSPEAAITQATEVDDDEYHERADEYMEALYERAEELQESREDVEVEYSAGVLSISFPPNGTYIINKQPPNKQIWLSSPTSGPKRFDFVLAGESMHQKEGGGTGEWVYLRDGTNLTALLGKELGIAVEAKVNTKPSTDPFE